MSDVVERTIEGWLATYGAPNACAATLLCDRHDPNATAFILVDAEYRSRKLSHRELGDLSSRLATGLKARGVSAGDRVGVLMSKRLEYAVTLMALWRIGAVLVPMFTAFQTGAIEVRVVGSGAKLVVTEPTQRSKVDRIDGVDVLSTGPEFDELLTREPDTQPAVIGPDGLIAMLFTSGTTGKPKGVPIPIRALSAFSSYLHFGLDVRADDVFWDAADPGWAYGLYYGVIGALAHGRTSILFDANFSADSTREVLRRFEVTNFTGAPTMYRAMAKDSSFHGFSLRRASSAGEPLTPDVIDWGREALGVEVRDHYGQTEHGMCIVNCWHDDLRQPVKTGSMGPALPGFAAGVIDGQIVLDVKGSSLMYFHDYCDAPEKTAERFTADGRWYLTGDIGRVDDEGHFYFDSRDDDVILASGYRIGPYDVENVVSAHPSVDEVAVVGKPDTLRGEVVTAYVVLVDDAKPSDELAKDLQELVRNGYSAHAYPRVVNFVETLPKTPSGKIQRYLLKHRVD
ncbi:MAG: AMP-binding protein [Rhodococcus sp. (in: high G+C Gram-positive bacteria)]|uniref:AMP-binding protein n=1 Tax=Rhodococcus sp. TaxID=1831 RepID=UPI002ADC671F|nr:AMP-binding protein [Rhodococcus sp. (in: high G+C Gram-positive bacteria)]